MVVRRLLLPLLALALVLAPSRRLFSSSLSDVKRRGELVMLCFPHQANQFITVRNGEYWGLDHEILRTFASSIGVELRVVPVPQFADLIPWLLDGKGDVIGSSFSITDERKARVDFSDSYFPVRIVIVGRKDGPVPDLGALSWKRMAAVPGSSLEAFVKKKIPSIQIVPVPETPDAYEAVHSGNADYAPVDSTSAITDLAGFPDLDTRYTFPDRMGYGFAVERGSDLGPALSEHIHELRSSGLLYQQLGRFLGPRAVDIVKAADPEK